MGAVKGANVVETFSLGVLDAGWGTAPYTPLCDLSFLPHFASRTSRLREVRRIPGLKSNWTLFSEWLQCRGGSHLGAQAELQDLGVWGVECLGASQTLAPTKSQKVLNSVATDCSKP